jgi:hypothetical protein
MINFHLPACVFTVVIVVIIVLVGSVPMVVSVGKGLWLEWLKSQTVLIFFTSCLIFFGFMALIFS